MQNFAKALSISIALLTPAVLPAGALAAAPIITPPITATSAASGGHFCVVLNTGKVSYTVTVEIVAAFTGGVAGTHTASIGPGTVTDVNVAPTALLLPGGVSYCRVTGISKGKARVTHCALNAASNACESTVTVP